MADDTELSSPPEPTQPLNLDTNLVLRLLQPYQSDINQLSELRDQQLQAQGFLRAFFPLP